MNFSPTIISLLAIVHRTVAIPTNNADVMDRETFYNLTLPEYTSDGLKIVDLRNPKFETRAVCNGDWGIANGEFLHYCSQQGCPNVGFIKGYKPTCNSNYYADEFASVKVSGYGTYSTIMNSFRILLAKILLAVLEARPEAELAPKKKGCWSMKCFYRC